MFLALLALVLANQIGFGLVIPVLPAYAKSFGLGAADIGFVIAIYGLARFVANVPVGQLAERFGRRHVIILGTAITSIASALIATAGSLPELLAYRFLAGLGAATVLTSGQIMVGDLATPENRGRMISTYQGFLLVGISLGPLPGGLLADWWGLRAPFVAYAIFSALACVFAFLLIRETRPVPTSAEVAAAASIVGDVERSRVFTIVRSRAFLLVGFVTFSQFFARTGAIFAIVPLLGHDRFQMTASRLGAAQTLITALNLALVYFSGSLADRFGRKVVIAPATIASGLALLMWAWSPSETERQYAKTRALTTVG
ncbi:MAG: MFS transporter, partial [Chloroflexota bacterium]